MNSDIKEHDKDSTPHGLSSAEGAVLERFVMLPCPFCGETPEVEPPEENYGTWYEIECVCGMAKSGIQISDLLSRDENAEDEFIGSQFELRYRERARDYCIMQWNTRAI